MIRFLFLLFATVLFVFSFPILSNADTLCTIESPSTIAPGEPYTISITGDATTSSPTSVWRVKVSKNGNTPSLLETYSGNISRNIPSNSSIQEQGSYEFSVEQYNPATGGSPIYACGSSELTRVDDTDPDTTPVPYRACWVALDNSYDCHNTCTDVPPTEGEFDTQAECLATIPTPTSALPGLTPYATPPISPPPPPCLEGTDRNNQILNTKTNPDNAEKIVNCQKVATAFGDLSTDPKEFIKWLFGLLLGIAGGIALLIIMFSGYTLMTSQGDPEKIKGAQENLTSAIVGLLFMLFSFVILEVIGVDILHIPGLGK